MTSSASVESTPLPTKRPPRVSRHIPFLGHLIEFGKSPVEFLDRARREAGEVSSFTLFGKPFVFLSGPRAQEALFLADDNKLSFREPYRITVPIFGKGVVYDAEPAVMSEQLGFLMQSLRDKRLRSYAEQVADEVDRYVADWGDSGERDLLETTKEITTYTSSRCLLGKEFRDEMTGEFAKVYHDMEAGLVPLGYLNPDLPIPAFRKRDKARVKMVEMISAIIAKRRKSNTEGEDFLQTLMESTYQNGQKLSDDEITGLLLAVIFAGHHTSSVTAAWSIIELLKNPRYLPPIVDELDRVYGLGTAQKQPVTYTSLRELVLLENAVKEAGRLNPPLILLMRKLVQDLHFKDYVIPSGTYAVVSPYVAHRLPEVFKDAKRFDPTRFDAGREEDKQSCALITFGAGRHKCLGMHFAHMQIKAFLSTLLRRYEIELVQGVTYEPDWTRLVLGPKQPCPIRYKRRVVAA